MLIDMIASNIYAPLNSVYKMHKFAKEKCICACDSVHKMHRYARKQHMCIAKRCAPSTKPWQQTAYAHIKTADPDDEGQLIVDLPANSV